MNLGTPISEIKHKVPKEERVHGSHLLNLKVRAATNGWRVTLFQRVGSNIIKLNQLPTRARNDQPLLDTETPILDFKHQGPKEERVQGSPLLNKIRGRPHRMKSHVSWIQPLGVVLSVHYSPGLREQELGFIHGDIRFTKPGSYGVIRELKTITPHGPIEIPGAAWKIGRAKELNSTFPLETPSYISSLYNAQRW